jgi:hypothetical protein
MTLPATVEPCLLTFAAFRAGFVTVLDRLLLDALDPHAGLPRRPGLFDCFPLLDGVASQIQLECLLQTWSRWRAGFPGGESELDECVRYACWEALARVSPPEQNRMLQAVLRVLPGNVELPADHWLRSRVRCRQIADDQGPENSLLRALLPLDRPESADPVGQSLRDPEHDDLLSLTGRWAAIRHMVLGSEGLLTEDEQGILRAYFEEHPGLVRS